MVVMLHNNKPSVACLNVKFVQGCLGVYNNCCLEGTQANLEVKAKFLHRAGQLVTEEIVAVFFICHLLGQWVRVQEQGILQVTGELCKKLVLELATTAITLVLVLAIVRREAELLWVIKRRAITFAATDT